MRLTHVRLLATDMSAMYRFYRHTLELPTTWDENPGYAEFQAGPDTAIAILPRAEMADVVPLRPAGDGVALILNVEDVDTVTRRLAEQGIEVTEPRDRPDWGIRVAHLRDPEGNLVELYHDIEWVRDS